MLRCTKLTIVIASSLFVAACDEGGGGGDDAQGIETLGSGFVNAFNQNRNDTPVNAQSVNLTLTPQQQPFNP